MGRILMGLIAVLVVASEALGQAPAAAPRRTIERINGDVYTATNNNHRTVFLVTKEGIILGDPINADFAKWIKAEFATRFKVPVRYVVYSHHHWDHASGGDVFADTAKFVGHANMLSNLAMPPASTTLKQVVGQYTPIAKLDKNGNGTVERAEAPPNVQQTQFAAFDANRDGVLSGAEVVRGPVSFVRPPDTTYKDKTQITLGGKRVDISWVGDMNHSSDSSFIAFPDDSVLFLVDFVSFRRLPNQEMDYEEGKFEEWMTAIGKAEKMAAGFKFVATGHGPVGTVKDITAWREYFEKLRTQVAAGIKAGQTLEQMQQNIKMAEYSNWDGFDWVPLNVLGMYHFLTDKPVGK
jgi:glyoxylase-like metal-dependent hydrolase (beta-lactamase superfamily II)